MTLSKLGSYELQEEIGRGGMGIVYSAIQPSLGRRVAIKVLLPHLSQDSEFVERFLREARAAASLEHPGIVTIHDVDEADGTYFFSMRFLEGTDLESMIQGTDGLPFDSVADLAFQLGEALGYAHAAGIVHRDVKPANVLVEEGGRAVLTDFGIAWASSETRLTRTGSSIGSPDYMSPEQITGRSVDQRSDLYSLGVVLYQMLTGRLPFSGTTPIALAYQHVNEPVPSAREQRPEIPEALDAIIQRLMAKEPDERYPTADEFLEDLIGVFPELGARRRKTHPSLSGVPLAEAGLSGSPTEIFRHRRSVSAVGLAMSVVGLILIAALFFYYRGREEPVVAAGGGGAPAMVSPPAGESPPVAAAAEPDDVNASSPETTAAAVESGSPGEALAGEEEESVGVPEVRKLTITTQPPGATVTVNGAPVDGVTPVEIEVAGDDRQQVALSLEGHEPAGWAFTWGDLSDDQLEKGELHFPLQASAPPGTLEIRSPYEAVVRVAGRRHEIAPGANSFDLPAGSHRVRIEAPEVFYESEQTIEIESESSHDIVLPPVYTVRVFAVPGNCRLRVDGRDVDDLPISALRLTAGTHEFEFRWESLGQTRVLKERVGPGTRQISAAASR